MNIAYLRVSTEGQNLERQDDLKSEVDKVFEEKATAKDRNRPQLQALIEFAREGDMVKVWSIDRLARSLPDLEAIVQQLNAKGVAVSFVKENMTFSTDTEDPFQRVMFQVLGAFAQFERAISKQRQAEGIAKAKAAGKYRGRQRKLTDEQVAEARQRIALGIPKAVVARDLGVARQTLYRELSDAPSRV